MSHKLPTFIIIGPGRSGTTWMYEMLSKHPEVCLARGTKETLFFTTEYDRGEEWYRDFFSHCTAEKAVGEISNSYIYDPEVPRRIRELLPDVKLITCLRNPVERLESVYFYRKRAGTLNTGIEAALEQHKDLITDNYYGTQLSRFLEFFPKEQVEVLFFDDLKTNPGQFIVQLYEAIGVSPEFVPDVVNEKVNQGAKARIPGSSKVLGGIAKGLRKLHLHEVLSMLKRNKVVRSLLLKELKQEDKQALPAEVKQQLTKQLLPEIESVEALTGRNLSHWKKAAS